MAFPHWLLLPLVVAMGLAIRLYRIDAASFWSDELFSVFWIRNPALFLWTEGLEVETTPPLYYALLQPWAALFGDGEFAIRAFSAALSAATIPLVYLLGRQIAGRSVGLLAAALFALMPMQVHYAQEARAYALLPLLFAAAVLSLLGYLRAWGRLTYSAGRQWRWLAAYGLAALLLVYAHATSAFTLAALGLCTAAALLLLPGRWPAVYRLALVNAAVVLLAIPEIRVMLVQSGRFDMQWVEPPGLITLLSAANAFLVDPSTPLTLFRLSCILAAAMGGLFLLLLLRARPRLLTLLFLVATPALFLVATILLSYASPFFIPRITIWIGVPFCILAAMLLLAPLPRWQRAAFALALVLAWGVGLQGVFTRSQDFKEDWRGAAASLAPRLQAGDLVLIGPHTNVRGLAYYIGTDLRQNRWLPEAAPYHPLLFLPQGMQLPGVIATAGLTEAVAQGRQVWLVLKHADWLRWGEAAVQAAPRRPLVNQDHARLTLLHWPGGAATAP